jgi:hypothetical protein
MEKPVSYTKEYFCQYARRVRAKRQELDHKKWMKKVATLRVPSDVLCKFVVQAKVACEEEKYCEYFGLN